MGKIFIGIITWLPKVIIQCAVILFIVSLIGAFVVGKVFHTRPYYCVADWIPSCDEYAGTTAQSPASTDPLAGLGGILNSLGNAGGANPPTGSNPDPATGSIPVNPGGPILPNDGTSALRLEVGAHDFSDYDKAAADVVKAQAEALRLQNSVAYSQSLTALGVSADQASLAKLEASAAKLHVFEKAGADANTYTEAEKAKQKVLKAEAEKAAALAALEAEEKAAANARNNALGWALILVGTPALTGLAAYIWTAQRRKSAAPIISESRVTETAIVEYRSSNSLLDRFIEWKAGVPWRETGRKAQKGFVIQRGIPAVTPVPELGATTPIALSDFPTVLGIAEARAAADAATNLGHHKVIAQSIAAMLAGPTQPPAPETQVTINGAQPNVMTRLAASLRRNGNNR